jgi:hypothetical protein
VVQEIAFDEATHTYTVAGARVPSVTEIIRPLTFLDDIPEPLLRDAAERGTRVHAAVNAWNRGAFVALAPLEQGYVDAWQRFIDDTEATVVASELRVYHDQMRYAGTLDSLVEMDGKVWLIDVKTSQDVPPSVGPQTAAYMQAYQWLGEITLDVRRRGCVLLRPGGTYKLETLADPADWAAFQSCWNIYQWRKRWKA